MRYSYIFFVLGVVAAQLLWSTPSFAQDDDEDGTLPSVVLGDSVGGLTPVPRAAAGESVDLDGDLSHASGGAIPVAPAVGNRNYPRDPIVAGGDGDGDEDGELPIAKSPAP